MPDQPFASDPSAKQIALDRLKESLFAPASLFHKAQTITQGVVDIFAADFARLWLVLPGDLCQQGCFHLQTENPVHRCLQQLSCLHLISSSGRYTHTNSRLHGRVPVGCYKIGMIASGQIPSFVSQEVERDERIHDHHWVRELGLVSFAGFRLLSTEGKPIGVLALFSSHPITLTEEHLLLSLASTASHVMQSALAEEELRQHRDHLEWLVEQRTGALLRSEERLKLALDGSNDGLWDFDVGNNSIFYSQRWFTMLGYQPDQFPHTYQTWVELLHPEDRERTLRAADQLLAGKTQEFWGEYRMQTASSKWRWILSRGKTVRWDDQGLPLRVVGIHTDITVQKQIEEQFRILVADLERANKDLEDFAHVVSHDLKAPLRGIHTIAGWLQEDYAAVLDQKGHEYLEKLQARCLRLNDLVDGILLYSRAGMGRSQPAAIHCTELVQEVIETLTIPPGIAILIPEPLPVVTYDRTHLMQVFQNLIGNAVYHLGKPEGRVVIACDDGPDCFTFQVRDNGPGIAEKEHHRIFKIFQSLNVPGGRSPSGIGLSVVKKLVERNGGLVWLESQEGKGSTFFFTVRKYRIGPTLSLPGSLTFLVIDDSVEFIEITRTLLTLEGHQVLTAIDGPSAFQLLEEYRGDIHVVLMDVHIPGENARERMAILKKLRPSLKVIACTGYEQNDTLDGLKKAGVDGILQKPFTINQLNAIIEKNCDLV